MSNFNEVPYDDIKILLKSNKIIVPKNRDEAYEEAEKLIRNNPNIKMPDGIQDFIIAETLKQENETFEQTYKISDILYSTNKDLLPLALFLKLKEVNKERIIRILQYLGILIDNISPTNLPPEIWQQIINDLDCESIILLCTISKTKGFSKLCEKDGFEKMLRNKLIRSKFDISRFNRKQLINLCKMGQKELLVRRPGNQSFFLDIKGNLHVLGTERNGAGPYGLEEITLKVKNVLQMSITNNYGSIVFLDGSVADINFDENNNLLLNNNNLNNIISTSSNDQGTLYLDDKGNVYSQGSNTDGNLGQVGNGDYYIEQPTLINALDDIIQISMHMYHSLAVDINGNVYAFGSNNYGQLGLRDNDEHVYPLIIPKIKNIIKISAGNRFSLLLNDKGRVYAFGNNQYGQLGIGNNNAINTPKLLNIKDIVDISAGSSHSLLLDKYGQVYSFGSNKFGQLGLGDYTAQGLGEYLTAEEMSTHDYDRDIPEQIPDLFSIVQISAGTNVSFFLDIDGNVYGCGNNETHQFGIDNEFIDSPLFIQDLNLF